MTSFFARGVACLGAILITSAASAAVSKVICVPWQGDINKQHTAISGTAVTIKAVVKTSDNNTIYYKWNYGDGNSSGVLSTSGNTWYTLESSHTYAGASGTPFTATLTVADSADLATNPKSDNYLLKIEDNNLDARINLAIDIGLWYTYKQGIRGDGVSGSYVTFDSMPIVYWAASGVRVAPTASAVQAFEINGSKESGNFDQDPYAEYVARGLKFLIMGHINGNVNATMLRALTIGLQHGTDNPDSNGNGIGIEAYDQGGGDPPYQGGMAMDALIASGTPSMSSGREFVTGHVATYKEIIQDMVDMYAWGQNDGAVICSSVDDGGSHDLTGNGVPKSITLDMLNAQCGSGGTFTVYLNGISLGTFLNTGNCNCSPGHQLLVLDNASDLTTAWNATAAKIVRVTYSGGSTAYNSRTSVRIDWGGGNVKGLCVRSLPSTCFGDNLCDTSGGNNGYDANPFDVSLDLSNVHTFSVTCAAAGSWRYNWNYGAGQDDNSASQWAAIGMIPAQEAPWSAVVPPWVKSYDNSALNNTFYTTGGGGIWGHFGYTGTPSALPCPQYPCPVSMSTTPSGMVQLSFDDMTTADPRWAKSERWMADNWDTGENWLAGAKGNLYGMYAFTKAMRLAKPSPVVNLTATGLDWYRGSATHDGIAKVLSDTLIASATGSYDAHYWEQNPITTEWAVIMLKPTLFAAGPIACFTAHPNPSFANQPIAFDPGCSGHSDPAKSIANLKKFEWDWDNNGTYDLTTTTPDIVNHSFSCPMLPCTYPVKLRVTDDTGLTATYVLDIEITIPPHPPVSKPGGPYIVSLCERDTLTLDGSASFDPDEGQHQAGCAACPNDTITAYDWDLDGAPFNYDSKHGKMVALGTGFTTYFASAGSYNIGLKVTDNTKLAYPDSGEDNLDDEAFGVVQVYNPGPCTLTATPGCQTIKLDWNSVGATKYDVYRSTTGPNVGFASIGSTAGLTFTDSVVSGTQYWYRILATKGAAVTLSPAVASTDDSTKCLCVKDLKPIAKNVQVQLNWTKVAGASCYNVYRSTSPNVALVAGNRVATCVGAVYALWVDTHVVNGTKYYYKVTEVVSGNEVCNSAEVSVTPNRR